MDLPIRAKSLCCSLLSSPWCDLSPSDILIEPITTGRSNRLFICTRPVTPTQAANCETISEKRPSSSSSGSSQTDSPSPVTFSSSDDDSDLATNNETRILKKREFAHKYIKVIVRFYGSDLTGEGNRYKCVSDDEELEILAILSTRGMSPNVLAAFPGGRIDEYIESKTLCPRQLARSEILSILAIKIAQYHSTPFKCERVYNLVQIFRDNGATTIDILSNFDETKLPDRSESSILLLRKIKNFFLGKPADRLTSIFIKIKQKTVFVHFDLNSTNFLFPKKLTNQSKSPLEVMIIDVENSANNYRGIDLGKFFTELCIGDGTQDIYYIPDSLIETFVDCYLNEWKSIASTDQLDPKIDNHDHLTLEVQIGFLMNTVFSVAWNVLNINFGQPEFLRNTASRIDIFNHFHQRWSKKINREF